MQQNWQRCCAIFCAVMLSAISSDWGDGLWAADSDVLQEMEYRLRALEQQNAVLSEALEQGRFLQPDGATGIAAARSAPSADTALESGWEFPESGESPAAYQSASGGAGYVHPPLPASPYESRLANLESLWEHHAAEALEMNASDAKKPTLKVSGRIHLDYWSFPSATDGIGFFEHPSGAAAGLDPEDRFVFRRMRFGVAGDIPDNMLYKIEIEFAGGNNVEYRDVYLGFKELPWLQTVYIGNQKRPYGLDHINSSRYNVFLERPMVIEAFNQDSRRLGLASWGHTEDELFNWRYGVYNMELTQNDPGYFGDNYQLEVAGRLAATPLYENDGQDYLHLAVSGSIASPDGERAGTDTNQNEARFRTRVEARSDSRWLDTRAIAGATEYELLGLESVLNIGSFSAVAEYQNVWLQRDAGSNLFFDGAYVYVSYFLTGEHQPWDRKTGQLERVHPHENFICIDRVSGCHMRGLGAWQIAARASYLNLTDEDIQGGDGDEYTVALNWWWNPYARLQFNYSYGNIENHFAVNGFTSGHYSIIGTRFGVDF